MSKACNTPSSEKSRFLTGFTPASAIFDMRGFTLIEIFVSIAVIVVITAAILGGLSSFRRTSDLNQATDGVIAALRDGRLRTIESKDSSGWGVHLESTRVTLFKGTTFSQGAADNAVFNLPPAVTLTWSLQGGGTDVTFARISGETRRPGTLTLALVADASKTRTIVIRASGLVEVQ